VHIVTNSYEEAELHYYECCDHFLFSFVT